MDEAGYLDFTQFRAFVKRLRSRPELDTLVTSLSQSTSLDLDQFITFMQDTQQSSMTLSDLTTIYETYSTNSTMSSSELANFLLSRDSAAYDSKEDITWQDMSRPLCEYFISSSHNVRCEPAASLREPAASTSS